MREACIETSALVDLFQLLEDPDSDVTPLRVAKALHARHLRLVIPDMTMAQALRGTSENRFAHFQRLTELARCAGPGYFAIGASLGWVIRESELSFPDNHASLGVWQLRHDHRAEIFGKAASYAEFEEWHQQLHADAVAYINREGWLELDRRAHESAKTDLGLTDQRENTKWLREILAGVPGRLASNPMLEILVKEPDLRARVAAEPHRCPSLIALVLACTLNGYGAFVDPRATPEFADLRISRDSWTDARILAASASADLFISHDGGLNRRAQRIADWGLLKPKVVHLEEIIGQYPQPR